MRYARDETHAPGRPSSGRSSASLSRAVLGVVAVMSTARLVHPDVYASVGLDSAGGQGRGARPTRTGPPPAGTPPARPSTSSRSRA